MRTLILSILILLSMSCRTSKHVTEQRTETLDSIRVNTADLNVSVSGKESQTTVDLSKITITEYDSLGNKIKETVIEKDITHNSNCESETSVSEAVKDSTSVSHLTNSDTEVKQKTKVSNPLWYILGIIGLTLLVKFIFVKYLD